MASNPVASFINNIGMLVEQWIITYQQFIQHGFSHNDAIEHTKAFTTAILAGMRTDNGKDEGGKTQ